MFAYEMLNFEQGYSALHLFSNATNHSWIVDWVILATFQAGHFSQLTIQSVLVTFSVPYYAPHCKQRRLRSSQPPVHCEAWSVSLLCRSKSSPASLRVCVCDTSHNCHPTVLTNQLHKAVSHWLSIPSLRLSDWEREPQLFTRERREER